MTSFKAEYDAYCASFGVPDRIEAMFFDANAIPRGKWVPGKDVGKLIKGGLRIPEAAYAPNIFGEEVDATGLGSVRLMPGGNVRLYSPNRSTTPRSASSMMCTASPATTNRIS